MNILRKTDLTWWVAVLAISLTGCNPEAETTGDTNSQVNAGETNSDKEQAAEGNLPEEEASEATNLIGVDGNHPGYHMFNIQLPVVFRDGKPKEVYGKVINLDGSMTELPNSFNFTAYSYSDAGRQHYEEKLAASLESRCGRCHDPSYEKFFPVLLNPPPYLGGKPTNNQLFNKPAGANGTSHSGGTLCGQFSTPCSAIIEWYSIETTQ